MSSSGSPHPGHGVRVARFELCRVNGFMVTSRNLGAVNLVHQDQDLTASVVDL